MRRRAMGYGDDQAFRFGSLVRRYRHEAKLSQRELAAKAGLSVAALRDFEQGRRRRPWPSSLAALGGALGLNAEQAAGLARAAAVPRRHLDHVPLPRPALSGFASALPANPSGRDQGLWLAVLSPLEAWRDGIQLSLPPPARRAVLGLLLLDPGALVRRDSIIDALWGDAPPRTAAGLVQAHVSRIRGLLKPGKHDAGGDQVLDCVGGAYRLTVSSHELDLLCFRDLAARGADAQASGDVMAAAEFYDQAIGLWRGAPLADIDVLSAHPGVTALKRELAGVLLKYAEVACVMGQPHRVLPRLQAFADAEPLNELAHAHLMIALAGAGQQAAAISLYENMRLRLDRELGLYPGEELAEAYVRVLRQDIRAGNALRERVRRPAKAATVQVVPRQLPAVPRGFTGRDAELHALSMLLERDSGETGGVVIAALTGMAGIGKTALAVQWAHRVASRFPDGQLFVNLHGFGPSDAPDTPADAVRGFLTALGAPPARIPADMEGRAALYRSLLVGRRMLIVLDNAENAEQIRPLLPGSPGCLVLVSSRNRLTGLVSAEGAHLITLGVLTEPESRDLLSISLGAERAMAEPAAVSELIALCGRLPLALCDVAAHAAARPGLPLSASAAEMRDARSRLDVLETGESVTTVRMVFSWSRAKLGDHALRVFRLLGVHPCSDITVSVAASLAGIPQQQASLALTELCDEHLLTEYAPGRYSCHVLLRAYTAEWALTSQSNAERCAAVRRVLDYYLHAAKAASGLLVPCRTLAGSAQVQPGVVLEEIAEPGQAEKWFADEQLAILALVSHAAEKGYAPYAWELPWVVGWYFRSPVHRQRLMAAQESALAFAVRLGDLAGQTMARQQLAWLSSLLGDIDGANDYLDEADELASQFDDEPLRGEAAVGARCGCAVPVEARDTAGPCAADRAMPFSSS